jgi:low temperature requirement protein LtrA
LLVICQLVPLLCLARLLKRRATPRERALLLVLALYFAHTLIAYFANGYEQERMQIKFAILVALCNLSVLQALLQRRYRDAGVMLPTEEGELTAAQGSRT